MIDQVLQEGRGDRIGNAADNDALASTGKIGEVGGQRIGAEDGDVRKILRCLL